MRAALVRRGPRRRQRHPAPHVMPDAIYLDNAATTPLCAEARAAMEPWLSGEIWTSGNPSSRHGPGVRARETV